MRLCILSFDFFFSSRRRHTRLQGDWSSDVCSSDLTSLPRALTRPRAATCGNTSLKSGISMESQWSSQPICWTRQNGPIESRSEERRVGKESRSRGETGQDKRRTEARGNEGNEKRTE